MRKIALRIKSISGGRKSSLPVTDTLSFEAVPEDKTLILKRKLPFKGLRFA